VSFTGITACQRDRINDGDYVGGFSRADIEGLLTSLDFARVTFLPDNRRDLPDVTTPTLILQCSEDVIAPSAVGGLRPSPHAVESAGEHARDRALSESQRAG
jgi:pimeloyl-ACP methyl ester carboxylesterase